MELVRLTIGDLLRQTVRCYPERAALMWDGGEMSWHACLEQVEMLAAGLLACGVTHGTHVGFLTANTAEAVTMMLACWDIGAVTVLFNTALSAEELAPLLRLAEVSVLVSGGNHKDCDLLDTVDALCGDSLLQPVINLCGTEQDTKYLSLTALIRHAVSRTQLRKAESIVKPTDDATILFTSGTTSMPKAVPSTHYMRVNNARIQARDLSATEEDRFCVAIPMFHCFGLTANLLAAVAVGGCLCFPRSNRTAELLQTVATMRCTVLTCVPNRYFAMMARTDFYTFDLRSLRTGLIGGASYAPEQFIAIEKAFDMLLLSSLGQTEATAGITVCSPTDPLEIRSTTVGHFMEHVEGRIQDRRGMQLPVGETGEICIRSYCVMAGYYHASERTAAVIDAGGWLHTGDMGYLDTAGNLHLTGRLKDLIIRGGENIAPAEIELCLIGALPEIEQIKVVGVPDAHYGEELCACIQCKPGAMLMEERVRTTVALHFAHYKVPKYVVYLDRIPTTASGKVRSDAVRALCMEYLTRQNLLPN